MTVNVLDNIKLSDSSLKNEMSSKLKIHKFFTHIFNFSVLLSEFDSHPGSSGIRMSQIFLQPNRTHAGQHRVKVF